MIMHLVALLVLGLMCGSELNVALFSHPLLKRQPLETHILVRASLAALFGKVMPFWMPGSTLLNLWLLLPFENLNRSAWRFAAIAFAIQVLAVLFSLVGPVPINNRVAKWTPKSLPENWRTEEDRWDTYHFVRTCGLVVAFILLSLSIATR
jgi:anthrone oxygenase-like protein